MIISRNRGERIKQIAQIKANPVNPRRIFKKYIICCIRFFLLKMVAVVGLEPTMFNLLGIRF